MHDIRAVRADPAAFDAALARRGLPPAADALLPLDAERRASLTALQELQTRRNALSRQVGEQRRAGFDAAELTAEVAALRSEMEMLEQRAAQLEAEIRYALERLPNVLD